DAKQRKALEKERKRLAKAVEEGEAAVVASRQHFLECDLALREAEQSIERSARLSAEIHDRSMQVNAMEMRRKKIEARIQELQAAADASEIEADIAKLDERIARGEQIVAALQAAAQHAERVAKLETEADSLAADVQALETL